MPAQYQTAEISDDANREQIEAWYQDPSRLLTFYGDAGRGKTRMLWALYKRIAAETAEIYRDDYGEIQLEGVEIYSVPLLLKRLQALCGQSAQKELQEIRRLAHEVDVLLLDDLGTEKLTEFALAEFSLILSEREQWSKGTILTTNLSLKGVAKFFGDRIASRIEGGIVLRFVGPDRRLRRKE